MRFPIEKRYLPALKEYYGFYKNVTFHDRINCLNGTEKHLHANILCVTLHDNSVISAYRVLLTFYFFFFMTSHRIEYFRISCNFPRIK